MYSTRTLTSWMSDGKGESTSPEVTQWRIFDGRICNLSTQPDASVWMDKTQIYEVEWINFQQDEVFCLTSIG
jgi:hypothetical protein